jgi:hypothetical protein
MSENINCIVWILCTYYMAKNSQNVFRLLLWTSPVREASLKEHSLKMDDFLTTYTTLSVLFVCAEIVFD